MDAAQEIGDVILAHLGARGGTWATARELATEVGYPWRVVARALMRLAGDTHIEQAQHEWRSNRQRTRRCFIYRQVTTAHVEFPSWLMPQKPTTRRG